MSVALVMKFDGAGASQYDTVMRELDLPLHDDDNTNWPAGLISHLAGGTPGGGWCVVDVWDTQAAFEKFMADRLGAALEKAGITAQPQVTPVEVHNTHRHGR